MNEWFLYGIVSVLTLAFIVLIIYIVRVLKSMNSTMQQMTSSLSTMETRVDALSTETTELVKRTNVFMDDVNDKTKRLDTVVEAFEGAADTVNKLNTSMKTITNDLVEVTQNQGNRIAAVLSFGQTAFQLFERYRKNKEQTDKK